MNEEIKILLKKLYDDNVDSLYRYAYFKLNSKDDALDIIQEAFYKLWVELNKWNDIKDLKSYIYRIVSNKIIDYYKKNKPISLEEHLEEFWDNFSDNTDMENLIHAKLEAEKIYNILATLDDFEKDIFLLRFMEDVSPKEIAEIYWKDVNTITVRLHRIKDKVKSKFESS